MINKSKSIYPIQGSFDDKKYTTKRKEKDETFPNHDMASFSIRISFFFNHLFQVFRV